MPAAGRSHIVAPSGRLIPSALVLRPESRKKKVVRFRAGDDIREVRFFESHPDEHRQEEYGYDDENDDRRDHDRGDRDDRDRRDNRDNWGGYYDEEEERRRRMEYEDDRDRYYHDDLGRGFDQGYDNGYPKGYEHGRAYSDEHGYEHGYERGYERDRDDRRYDLGYEHGPDEHVRQHEYDHEYRHEQEQHHQQQQRQHYYSEQPYPEPTPKPVAHADEPPVPAVPAVPAFQFPEEETEKLVRGELWRPPQKLLIEHPEDKRHMEPATFGEESTEKMVQAEREADVPVVEYTDLASVPYSPAEPDDENEDMEQVDLRPKRKIELYEVRSIAIDYCIPFIDQVRAGFFLLNSFFPLHHFHMKLTHSLSLSFRPRFIQWHCQCCRCFSKSSKQDAKRWKADRHVMLDNSAPLPFVFSFLPMFFFLSFSFFPSLPIQL